VNLFSDIKNGILPDENVIFYILENNINYNEDEKEEIKKYIQILNNSLSTSSTEEKILIIRVLFVLEFMMDKEEAIKNFIYRSLFLNIHEAKGFYELKDYIELMTKFIEKVDLDFVFNILRDRIKELSNYSSLELRSFFNWILHIIWNIKKYYNNYEFISFYDNLKYLLDELMKQDRISDVMYVEFFTYHIMGNSFQNIDEWREFNQNVTKKTEPFYKKYTNNLPKCNPSKKPKKRIAFIKDRIVMNSPFMVEYSLFKSLMEDNKFRDNYELAVYSFNQFEKSDDDEKCIKMLNDIGVIVINPVREFKKDGYYNDHFKKALKMRETLIYDDVDIMIAGGVFPIVDFLYLSRTAPLQIYYSHGNCAFDIEGIDKRVSHFNQECSEFKWNIINVPMAKEFLVGTDGEKEVGNIIKAHYKEEFGDDVVILGTIGRLIKIDSDEYLEVVSKIMQENPNTIYLACGLGNTDNIKEKLKKYNIDEKRFLFLGMINPHIYGWVIDVWLNTFPLPQGNSQEEYHEKGHGIVIQSEVIINCKYDYEFIEKEILKEKPEVFFRAFEVNNIDKNISFNKLIFEVYKKHNKNINEKEILQCIEQIENLQECKDKWLQTIHCISQNKEYKEMYRWMTYKLWQEHVKWKNSRNKLLNILKG